MNESQKMFDTLCSYLGCDLDSKPCKELQTFLKENQDYETFIKKIKQTVKVYQEADKCDKIPNDVSRNLFEKLNLQELKSKDRI